MRFGIFSDVHSNLYALEAVLDAFAQAKVDQLVCAGDIVGYGANPVECLALFEKSKVMSVAGNHDWAVAGRLDYKYFADYAKKAVDWTREQIDFRQREHLSTLPLSYQSADFTVVHGTLNAMEEFHYMNDIEKSLDTFFLMKTPLCFIGHTHVPQVYVRKQEMSFYGDAFDFTLKLNHKYIVNVGSVGQPRDGNPEACYAIFDDETRRVSIKRTAYDVKAAQAKIWEAGLPDMLAQRLSFGQ